MKPICLQLLFLAALLAAPLRAQDDESRIRSLRAASNQALREYDHEKVLSFLTDDILTTTGAGTLLSGKKALEAYIAGDPDSKMYWVRTPSAISANKALGLAWETGAWKGYDPGTGENDVVGGNYSAMWTRESGEWKIKSQLFVTLE
ncbi:nuclear transport factor 2 family protein [Robiginitalea marina]|uniref:Nuclear transport factor 2 family protein n=1 Tax=Robiginitalea marina TaxID=2954105 RepID=A0ABT1AZQ4_9FLAO|nr:nuclear transport factor 2 family protein [Robiginitalea marina]MCO5725409.1 nuclear transport factor 2 family protein [Robiginitalea marina]